MRFYYALLLLLIIACQPELKTEPNEEKLATEVVLMPDSIKEPYNFLMAEFKRVNKDTTLETYYGKDFDAQQDLFDLFAIDRGDSIIVVNACVSCFFTTNSFLITIKKNKYACDFNESSCTYAVDFIPYKQSLILEDSSYQVGDTIRGKIEYVGRYSPDSLNRFYEEVVVRGSFKTVVRDTSYDVREDRINRIKILTKDTMEIRRRYPKWSE